MAICAMACCISTAAVDAAPLRLLVFHVVGTPRKRRFVGVMTLMMRAVTLVRIVAGQCAPYAPPLTQYGDHVRTSTTVASIRTLVMDPTASYGASEFGSTGLPFTTRMQTRNISTITIHKTAAKNTVSTASRR